MAAKDWRFSRQTLLNACLIQESIGHAGFDRLILELGIENVTTSQSGSGMKARANSLATFVLKNPDLVLDNGVTLAVAVVQQALQTVPRRDQAPSGVKDSVHQGFWKALVTDGYTIYQGRSDSWPPRSGMMDPLWRSGRGQRFAVRAPVRI